MAIDNFNFGIRKVVSSTIAIYILILSTIINVNANYAEEVAFIEQIAIPDDMNFTVSENCTNHLYFMQATANESGNFAVYSRATDSSKTAKNDFKRVFIDIYNVDGTFFQELSFTTPLDLAIEFTGQTLNIYFYSWVLVYDINIQNLVCYSIEDGVAVNNGKFTVLRQKNFESGEWQYTCVKGLNGYIRLERSNKYQNHILVEMTGTLNRNVAVWIPGFVTALIIIIFFSSYKARRGCR